MKTISTLLVFLIFSSASIAQKVDTLELDGKEYFVYPFRINVETHTDYHGAHKRKRSSLRSYRYYRELFADQGDFPVMSKKEYKEFARILDNGRSSKNTRKHINKKFYKAVRKNPYPLLEQNYSMGKDIVPFLDPMPDGEYIQLFEPFCIVDESGDCEVDSNLIAGRFSIKNNLLHGEAMWFNVKGDTLKHGWFVNGIKDGEWKLEERKLGYSIGKKDAYLYIERGFPEIDTTIEYITYKGGARNGRYRLFTQSNYPVEEGYYANGEKSGRWLEREIQFKGYGYKRKRIRNNEQITQEYSYANIDDSVIVRAPWIRDGLIRTYSAVRTQFNFYAKHSVKSPPSDVYVIAFQREPDLELEEEMLGGNYEFDEYDEYYEFERELEALYSKDNYEYSPFRTTIYDINSKKYILRGKLIDSLGAIAKYNGRFEEHYPNGQLAYSYEFKDGQLVKEDTIFWDNGNAHDVITFIPDSNHYLRTIYDYDGKPFKELAYDALGDFKRIQKSYLKTKKLVIEGYEVNDNAYGDYFFYSHYDTLETELSEPLTIFRSWFKKDTSLVYDAHYDPQKRFLKRIAHGATGRVMRDIERTFSEDFESWTGKEIVRISDLELVETASAAKKEHYFYFMEEEDTTAIPQSNVQYATERFEVTSDYRLKKAGENYSGPVELDFTAKKLTFSKKGLSIGLPRSRKWEQKLKEDLVRYRETGKSKYPVILDFIDGSEYGRNIAGMVYRNFFFSILQGHFGYESEDAFREPYDYGYDRDRKKKKVKVTYPVLTKIKGYMSEGKPQGIWISYDQFGNIMKEIPFEKGATSGELKEYAYAYPKDEADLFGWDYQYETDFADSVPEKRTHYVAAITNYRNGMKDGVSEEYNWYGETLVHANYKEDRREGEAMERNKLAHTRMTFKDGVLDGYIQTYLTLPKKDSILLYDLNFQDGSLQGESKAYHTNGKLAKRGFFLDGEPIEDYEAFDSLGFKYHYVKFKYSFPVEEKVWEENELSVRYLFNWEDSIHFAPTDITSSQSLESVLYKLGYGQYYLEQPYYGRGTLVSKRRVKCHMTKYYPNDTISRDGDLDNLKKVGNWKYYSYDGEFLYEADYQDTILVLNDSIKFKAKGILTDYDADGNKLHESYIIEKFEKYDCAHTDHYEIRQFYTKWEANDSLGRMNGYVQNFYDNGTLQSEGYMKNGLPDSTWRFYDPFGKLNQYGLYVMGKRNGRWLSGDLSKTKYLGDICLNPNLPDLEEEKKYRENLLDITITNYHFGKSLNKQYYDINMNRFRELEEEEKTEGE